MNIKFVKKYLLNFKIDFYTAKIREKYFDKEKMEFVHRDNKEELTTQNTFLGTAEYISPEVLFNNDVGPECDLWAVGI